MWPQQQHHHHGPPHHRQPPHMPPQPPPSYSPTQGGGTHPGMFSGQPQVSLSWVPARNGEVPPGAVQVGGGVFVARGKHAGELIPGKAAAGHRSAYLPYGGKENSVRDYEILCDTHIDCFGCNFTWQACNGRHIPHGALIGGHTVGGQPYYIGRSRVNGEPVAGKVFEQHGCAYFPYGGGEHTSHDFEVLVLRS